MGQVCLCNVEPVPSRLEWTLEGGSIGPIEQDAAPYYVEGYGPADYAAPAHNCNFGQFFCITDDGVMLPENSLGCVFQQHLHFLDAQQMSDFCHQNFSRLVAQAGCNSAFKDVQTALNMQTVRQKELAQIELLQQQMAQVTTPLQLQPPPVASAAAGAAAAAAAVQSSSSSSCPAAGAPMMYQPIQAAAASAQQVQFMQQGSAAAHSEGCSSMHAARAEYRQRWKQQQ